MKLLLGPTNLSMDLSNIECIRVQDSDEMYAQTIKYFKESDIVIFSAAISDFKPKKINSSKIKKESGLESIELQPTHDILKELGKIKTSQFLVGFALETDNVLSLIHI